MDDTHRPQHRTNPDDPNDWRPRTPADLYGHLLRGYAVPKSDNDVPPLQPRCTLDQYSSPRIDTSSRDTDQVVFRWMKKHKTRGTSEVPKMFMVDQLWLWMINQGDSQQMPLHFLSVVLDAIQPVVFIETISWLTRFQENYADFVKIL